MYHNLTRHPVRVRLLRGSTCCAAMHMHMQVYIYYLLRGDAASRLGQCELGLLASAAFGE